MAHDSFRAALASRVILMSRFNAPSPGFAFQQRECTTSRREFLWKNFYSARIKFSPRMLSRFCFAAGFSSGSWRRVFFLAGSRRVQISRRDSCRDTRREFFPGRILPGKRPSRRDPGRIPVSAGNLGGIPARSRYLFYKGKNWITTAVTIDTLLIHTQTKLR